MRRYIRPLKLGGEQAVEEENGGRLGFIEGEVDEEFRAGSGGGGSCGHRWRSSGGRMGVRGGKNASGDGGGILMERRVFGGLNISHLWGEVMIDDPGRKKYDVV